MFWTNKTKLKIYYEIPWNTRKEDDLHKEHSNLVTVIPIASIYLVKKRFIFTMFGGAQRVGDLIQCVVTPWISRHWIWNLLLIFITNLQFILSSMGVMVYMMQVMTSNFVMLFNIPHNLLHQKKDYNSSCKINVVSEWSEVSFSRLNRGSRRESDSELHKTITG